MANGFVKTLAGFISTKDAQVPGFEQLQYKVLMVTWQVARLSIVLPAFFTSDTRDWVAAIFIAKCVDPFVISKLMQYGVKVS